MDLKKEQNSTFIRLLSVSSILILVSVSLFSTITAESHVKKMDHFYLLFSSSILLCIFFVLTLKSKAKISIKLNHIDLFVVCFTAFFLFQYLLSPLSKMIFSEVLPIITGFAFYLVSRIDIKQKGLSDFIQPILALLNFNILLQIFICIGQYFGFLQKFNSELEITGSFSHSAQLGTFLSLHVIVLLGILSKKLVVAKQLKLLTIFNILISLAIIFVTDSRTSWLAILAGVFLVISQEKKAKNVYHRFITSKKRKILFLLTVFVVATSIASAFYFYKKGSADVRIFNSSICVKMLCDKPLSGHGLGTYQQNRPIYQSEYFKNNPDSKELIRIAGAGSYACNDILELGSETGIFGILLFIMGPLLVYIFRYKNKIGQVGFIGLIGFLTILTFSYPFSNGSHILIYFFLFSLANNAFENSNSSIFTFNSIGVITIFAIILTVFMAMSIHQIPKYRSTLKWNNLATAIVNGDSDIKTLLPEYKKLEYDLQEDPYFLYNYALNLSNIESEIPRSINYLEKTLAKLPSLFLYNKLAFLYEKSNNTTIAEKYYLMATHYVPSKFSPHFELLNFYERNNNHEKALEVCNHIVKMETKVFSDKEAEIRRYATNYLLKSRK